MANEPNPVHKLVQFGRQAQYLAERQNPYYSSTFKAVMRYVPLAMRLYRFARYWEMERDWSMFDIEGGRSTRQELAKENEAYVKRMAPAKYWDALIPKTEIGCKRKVLDTDYLKTLWRDNFELVADDQVDRITETGVVTKSGRQVKADAIVLAIGFATQQMLFPMKIEGRGGLGLNNYVRTLPQSLCGILLIYPVGHHISRSRPSIPRNVRAGLSQLLHYDGPEYSHWAFERVRQNLYLPNPATSFGKKQS
jgi:glycine/D-amino acid oxidase-like deaminating enzyme